MSETSVNIEIVGKPALDGKFMEVEDFWMARLQSVENQYDEHVRTLERKLLDQRRNTRLLTAVQQHNARLQGQVTECTEAAQGLSKKLGALQANLKETTRQKTRLESELTGAKETVASAKQELRETLGETKTALRQRAFLNERLAHAEDEKRKLRTAVQHLENDLGRTRDQIHDTERKEAVLTRALVRAEAERQKLDAEKQRASQTVRYFMKERENDDERIYRIKSELEQVLDQLEKERLVGLEIFRQNKKGQKQLRESQKDLSEVLSKMDQKSFETLNWKQEATMLKKLIRAPSGSRNDYGRGRVAQLKQHMLQLERKMEEMERERRKTDAEVKNLKALHESLTKIQHQNLATRKRLQPKPKPECTSRFIRKCKAQENSMSAKQVQTLQTKVKGLEKELNHCKSKISVMRLELSGKLGLEKELRWTEKALLQAEADKIKISDIAKSSAQQLGGNSGAQALLKQKLMTQIGAVHKLWDSAPKVKERALKKDCSQHGPVMRTPEQIEAAMASARTELALAERRQAVFNALQETAEASKAANAARLLEEAEEEEEEHLEAWQDVDTEELLTSEAEFLSSSSSSSASSSAKEGKRKKSGGDEETEEDATLALPPPPPTEGHNPDPRTDEVEADHKEDQQLQPVVESENVVN